MALVCWTTDEIADTRLVWGLSGQTLSRFIGDIPQTTDHLVVLTNLSPSTDYSVRACSADPSGNLSVESAPVSFTTTVAPDRTGPVFTTSPSAVLQEKLRARISWTTDELATRQVLFGTEQGKLYHLASLDGLGLDHAVTLTNLAPAMKYYYVVVSIDSSGNRFGQRGGGF